MRCCAGCDVWNGRAGAGSFWQLAGHAEGRQRLRVIFNFYKGDKDAVEREDVQHRSGRASDPGHVGDQAGIEHQDIGRHDRRHLRGEAERRRQDDYRYVDAGDAAASADVSARHAGDGVGDSRASPPPKRIPADANPTFEVATIKPTQEGTRFSIHPTGSGELVATDASLAYLIKFAYEVHPRQITKGPAWLDTDKYDLTAKPDIEGQPSLKQMRVMVQKLLADRFQLTFHREKIELPVYAVTVARGGPSLPLTTPIPDGNPGYGGGPGGMRVVNSTIAEFISFVLNDSIGLPVVDQTGLGSARYNFVLKWTPDASQSQPGGMPAGAPPADNADAPPDIFTAMQQQLGLKLESTKALVDVMVIDHVEKPSPN